MKLNKQGKEELRAKIVEQLEIVPAGQRVHLDKELLEELLFEVVIIDNEKDIKVKLPIWSGSFLRKIDLSQVDFSNVSWALLDPTNDLEYLEDIEEINLDESFFDRINTIRTQNVDEERESFIVDYYGTNANIDLTKSFEAIYLNFIEIRECNFEGLDFSQIDLSGVNSLYLCNSSISKTKLTIPKDIEIMAHQSFLKDIDLSSRKTKAVDYFFEDAYNILNCHLENTGIQIELNEEDFKDGLYPGKLREAMAEKWVGCYVNGKEVKSLGERKAIAKETKEEYEKMKEDLINSTISSIEQQTNGFGRK